MAALDEIDTRDYDAALSQLSLLVDEADAIWADCAALAAFGAITTEKALLIGRAYGGIAIYAKVIEGQITN